MPPSTHRSRTESARTGTARATGASWPTWLCVHVAAEGGGVGRNGVDGPDSRNHAPGIGVSDGEGRRRKWARSNPNRRHQRARRMISTTTTPTARPRPMGVKLRAGLSRGRRARAALPALPRRPALRERRRAVGCRPRFSARPRFIGGTRFAVCIDRVGLRRLRGRHRPFVSALLRRSLRVVAPSRRARRRPGRWLPHPPCWDHAGRLCRGRARPTPCRACGRHFWPWDVPFASAPILTAPGGAATGDDFSQSQNALCSRRVPGSGWPVQPPQLDGAAGLRSFRRT